MGFNWELELKRWGKVAIGVALLGTGVFGYIWPKETSFPTADGAVLVGSSYNGCDDYLRRYKDRGHVVKKGKVYYCYRCPGPDWKFVYNPKRHQYECLHCTDKAFSIEKDLYYNPYRWAYECVICPKGTPFTEVKFWKRGKIFVCVKPGEKLPGEK